LQKALQTTNTRREAKGLQNQNEMKETKNLVVRHVIEKFKAHYE